jgi:hypothetical protein
MKKVVIGVAMVLALGMVANVFADETVPFPFWQHGWAIMSFWSISNYGTGAEAADVTISMLLADGTEHAVTSGNVLPGRAWQVSTAEEWYTTGAYGDGAGFGTYEITFPGGTSTDTVYLWGAVYADLGTSQPGYTIILPGNPYGVPGE